MHNNFSTYYIVHDPPRPAPEVVVVVPSVRARGPASAAGAAEAAGAQMGVAGGAKGNIPQVVSERDARTDTED